MYVYSISIEGGATTTTAIATLKKVPVYIKVNRRTPFNDPLTSQSSLREKILKSPTRQRIQGHNFLQIPLLKTHLKIPLLI